MSFFNVGSDWQGIQKRAERAESQLIPFCIFNDLNLHGGHFCEPLAIAALTAVCGETTGGISKTLMYWVSPLS
jgi:hypothetical protein